MELMFRLRELYAQKAAPAWSWLVATLNDPNLIAVVLFCLISLLVTTGRLRWNEWYVVTHPDGVERPVHTGYVLEGGMVVKMNDGTQGRVRPL